MREVVTRAGWLLPLAVALVAGAVLLVSFWLRGDHGEPLDSGPVLALGGGIGRVDAAREIVAGRGETTELLVSSSGSAIVDRRYEDCRVVNVRCVVPDPLSTYGEAMMAARLARLEDWPGVTIVTDDLHAPRARLLFSRCVDAPTSVVAIRRDVDNMARLRQALREVAATAVTFVVYRCEGN